MKNIKIYLAIFAMMPFLFSSCTKDESVSDTGVSPDVAVLYLGPVLEGLNQTRQQEGDIPQCTEDEAAFASIRLTYGPNNTPVEVTVEILEDEQGLFTAYDDKLEIPVVSGNSVEITLTDFVVLNDNQDPIWMAPKLGSDFAKFVSHPLSRKFDLRAGSKNYVNVDVLCFDDRVVNMYGYQFFDITQVPLYKFCVFANYCSDSGRHFTADYEFSLYKYLGDNQENPLQPASNYQLIHEEESPVKGNDDGTYWADPLCMVIPGKPKDKGPNDAYLFYEIKLVNWAPYYATDGTFAKSGYLTWNQISDLLTVEGDDSNSTVDYWHFFFNCGDDDGPVECDINDPDADCDGDSIPNGEDQCPGEDDTVDVDNDNIPDCKDDLIDSDGDGVADADDQCSGTPPNIPVDSAGCEIVTGPCNGIGDSDNDGICDDVDNCIGTANPDQNDFDGDGKGDSCDDDIDGDGIPNAQDLCSETPLNTEVDNTGCPIVAGPCDGIGDSDNDGVCDDVDNCIGTPNPNQEDFDGDGIGDVCDSDIDDDGVPNGSDNCDRTVEGAIVNSSGCSICDQPLYAYIVGSQDPVVVSPTVYDLVFNQDNVGLVLINTTANDDIEIQIGMEANSPYDIIGYNITITQNGSGTTYSKMNIISPDLTTGVLLFDVPDNFDTSQFNLQLEAILCEPNLN